MPGSDLGLFHQLGHFQFTVHYLTPALPSEGARGGRDGRLATERDRRRI